MKNLLLIDSTVTDYQTFVDAVNADTISFVYRSSTTAPLDLSADITIPNEPYVHQEATTRQSILDFIGETTIDRIGIVFTMHANVFLEGDTFFEGSNVHFILTLIQKYQVKNIDYFACNTLQYPEWNDYYAKISETGVVVGASNNKTGNLQYGGDWVLESTNQDVEFIYFTNTIEYYKYLLDTSDTGFSSVVIKTDGQLWGTGSNAKNQLGSLGSATQIMSYSNFTQLTTAGPFIRFHCSVNFTLALKTSNLFTFMSGSNADGQLGNYGGIQFQNQAPGGSNGFSWTHGAGEFFSFYIDDEATVWARGVPGYAYGLITSRASRVRTEQVACGKEHSIYIDVNSKFLYAAGLNSNYQVGTGNSNTAVNFVLVGGTNKFVAVACGAFHSLALRDDGTIWGSGLNSSNQLGNLYGSNTTFVQISPANKLFIAVAGGATHTLALNMDGTIWGTGSNAYNQLGTLYGSSTTFVQLTPTGTSFRQISCGTYGSFHSLAIDSNNNLWGTGLNTTNQLGSSYGSNTTFTQLMTNVTMLSNQRVFYLDVFYVSNLFTLSSNTNVTSGNSLTIYGTNLANVAYVTFGSVQVSTFISKTQFQIVFTVPSTGNLINYVKINNAGVNYPATNSDVNKTEGANTNVTITSISQQSNGLITVNGTNFSTPTVTMTGGFTSGTVTKVSSTQLTFTPNAFISSSTFTVTDGGSSASSTVSFPTITTITQAASGVVTINGSNFTTSIVTMTGGFTSGTVTKVTSTQLTFTPNSHIETATFTITDSGSSVAYTTSFPTITSISQAASGLVTLNGSNFTTSTVTISGGITSGTVTRVSSSQLTFTPSAFIGSNTIIVTDSGSSDSITSSFPTIASVIQAENGLVTINGSNYISPTVSISGGYIPGAVTKVSSSQLTFTPNIKIETATFTITDSGNSIAYTISFPTLTTVTQAASGLVTVNGTNFTTPTVTITGGITSGTVTKVSSSQLTFTPSAYIGTATITVTDGGNILNYSASFPSITSITQYANGLITLNGTNFTNPIVTITGGITSGTVTKVSSSQLTFTPNTRVVTATFTVTDTSNAASFTISFFTVTRMVQSSNGVITVTGTNFTSPSISISGYTSGTVTRVSSTQLTFTPNSFIGNATFTFTDSGSSLIYIESFPTLTSFTPVSGNKNTTVTLTGTNLGNITTVLFGSVAASNPTVSSTTVTVNAPINTKSVTITLSDSIGNSVSTSTPFKYSTNSSLFITNLTDPANKLLTQLSLTDGMDTTGIVQIGSLFTTTNLVGPSYGSTVVSSDNSSSLATTAFVKSQGYGTSSFTGYAQMAATQTWSALQTFSSGILSSTYDALTPTSTVSVGTNLTTGTLNLATSTATLNLNAPFSPIYTTAPTSTQIGYNITLAPLNTSNYSFSGGNRVFRYVSVLPGTYISCASAKPAINLDYFYIIFAALKFTPAVGVNIDNVTDVIYYESSMYASASVTNIVLGGSVWSTSGSVYIPPGYTSLAIVTNTYKAGNPNSFIETSMSVTRIA